MGFLVALKTHWHYSSKRQVAWKGTADIADWFSFWTKGLIERQAWEPLNTQAVERLVAASVVSHCDGGNEGYSGLVGEGLWVKRGLFEMTKLLGGISRGRKTWWKPKTRKAKEAAESYIAAAGRPSE